MSASEAQGPTVHRWRVRGRVQGVGFRWFTCQAAGALGLRGTVRNLPDGGVEILLIDPDADSLDRLRAEVRKGPAGASVTDLEESGLVTVEADRAPLDEGLEMDESELRSLLAGQGFRVVY